MGEAQWSGKSVHNSQQLKYSWEGAFGRKTFFFFLSNIYKLILIYTTTFIIRKGQVNLIYNLSKNIFFHIS